MLDLFAGSGAMGLEALSRGAAHATFVEADRAACQTINRNLDKLDLEGATVLCQDALTALRADARMPAPATISCWSTRPYRRFSSLQNALIQLPARGSRARRPARSSRPRPDEEPDLPPLAKRTSRRYGSARLTLFEHADA